MCIFISNKDGAALITLTTWKEERACGREGRDGGRKGGREGKNTDHLVSGAELRRKGGPEQQGAKEGRE